MQYAVLAAEIEHDAPAFDAHVIVAQCGQAKAVVLFGVFRIADARQRALHQPNHSGQNLVARQAATAQRKLVYSVPFTTRANTAGPIGTSFVHVCPGILGGHEWNGAAYSPTLNTLFVPATDWCAPIRKSEAIPDPEIDKRRGLLFGGDFQFDPWADAKGCLTAFDAAAGVRRWRYHSRRPIIGGSQSPAGI